MNKKTIIWLNYMKTFSIIMVILIHVTYQALLRYSDSITIYNQIIGYSLRNLCWCAVPCFLIISGYLLLDEKKQYSIKYIASHYIIKMIGVLLTFGVLFAWLEIIYSEKTISLSQIFNVLINVLAGNTWSHLWYVYSMIGIYIMLPVYKIIADNIIDEMLMYFLLIMAIYVGIFPILKYLNIDIGIKIPEFTFLGFWLFMGNAIRKNLIKISFNKAILLMVISSGSIVIFSIIKVVFKLKLDFLFGYSSIIVMGQAIGLVFIFKQINYKEESCLTRIITKISSNSLLIYVVHMLYVNLLYKMFEFNPFSFGVLWVFVVGIVVVGCFGISYITAWGIKKILSILNITSLIKRL